MKTRIDYELSDNPNSSYSASGYSKFYERLSAKQSGKLRGNVYGLPQAIEHANELRHSVYEGRKIRLHNTFTIRRIVTTYKTVKTLKSPSKP